MRKNTGEFFFFPLFFFNFSGKVCFLGIKIRGGMVNKGLTLTNWQHFIFISVDLQTLCSDPRYSGSCQEIVFHVLSKFNLSLFIFCEVGCGRGKKPGCCA
jgi:hypothetical protein